MEGKEKVIKELETHAKTYKPYTGGENGIYVSRVPDPLSTERLVDFVHEHALCRMSDRDIDELHCTIMYSPTGLSSEATESDIQPVPFPVAARIVRFEFWPGHDDDGYLVACLQSDALQSIHKLWRLRGGIPTYSVYQPHITVQTPFEEYREFSYRLKRANMELEFSPMLIRLQDERVEDIKHPVDVKIAEVLDQDQ